MEKPKEPQVLTQLLKRLAAQFPGADLDMVRLAYEFADQAHQGQKRTNGEPYITHALAVANKLSTMRVDLNTVIAGLLHDVPEDTSYTVPDIRENFGVDVAALVEGITKLGTLKYRGMERYVENLRKMFLAISKDVRVVLIKFADRLHNLETLDALAPEKRQRIALESMEIFAPIAHRLGMWEIKGQLEDLSFKYTDQESYAWVSQLMATTSPSKEKNLAKVMALLRDKLDENQTITVLDIEGRAKFLYSLYKKLLRHDRDISKIYDLVAVRVIVENVTECYAVLGIIHQLWKPLRGRIKDYIAQPKPNGYQSLHTTVFVGPGEIVEFQIRTKAMDEESHYGPAAHWYYTEQGKPKEGIKMNSPRYAWVTELVKLQKEIRDTTEYLEHLKIDVFPENIFVFTPGGDVIALPDQATPVDFAYHIHSDIGNHCVAARINNKLMPLSTPLKSGDMVDIVIDKKRARPSPDWLQFVKTRTARERIKLELNRSRQLFGLFKKV
ncbi:MAG: RelA/SpoT family protein [Patescibacteria group bacterium]